MGIIAVGARRLGEALRNIGLARRTGLRSAVLRAAAASGMFDERYYLSTNPDVAEQASRPFEHYLNFGRFENRKPSAIFDPDDYVDANPDVAASGADPFLHYALVGRAADAPLSKAETIAPRPELTREIVRGTTRLIVFLTPGYEAKVGGVLSIASIYAETQALAAVHRAKVAICAVPGDDPMFLKYGWFENNNYLLDLHALLRGCVNLEFLQLHVPEYAVNRVARWLEAVSSSLLRNVREIRINILLQNVDLIRVQDIAGLRRFGVVTVTTAHEAYGNAATRQRLGVAVHKLGIRNGPELYEKVAYRNKKPILVVSHDEHPLKEQVLARIAQALPRLEIRVVHNLPYEEYRALISDAKWALTFGEGLDFYFIESVFSGGNAFAVYNDRFFTPAFANLLTVYPSWDHLLEKIVGDLQRLNEPIAFERCWREAYDLLSGLYSTERFRNNLRAFYRGEFTFP